MFRLDSQNAVNQCPAQVTITAADQIHCEIICVQIINDFNDRGIERVSVGHTREAPDIRLKELIYIVIEFIYGHSFKGPDLILSFKNIEILGNVTFFFRLNHSSGHLFHLVIRFVIRIIECAMGKEQPFKINRGQFAVYCAIHIEHSDTILFRYISIGRLVAYRLHKFLKLCQ